MITIEQAAAIISAKNECVQLEKTIKWLAPKAEGDAVQVHVDVSIPNSISHDLQLALQMPPDKIDELVQKLLLKELQDRLVYAEAKLKEKQNPFPGTLSTEETFDVDLLSRQPT